MPLAVSDGFCSVFGADRETLPALGGLLSRHLHPDDLTRIRPDLETACRSPGGRYSALYRVRVREGEPYRWISGKGTVVRQAEGFYLLYVYFSDVHDETELHREELADRLRQEVLLSDILSTTKTAIFWKDADRRFLGANKAFLDYYGFSDLSEILGKNDEEMGWHTDPDPYKNDEERVLREGVSTYRVKGKCLARGENRDIVASKSPLILGGKIAGLVGSFEDVTNETRQQAEISRLYAKLEEQLADRELLMSISEVSIVKIRLSDFTLLEYNDAMCRMIGCTQKEYEARYGRSITSYFSGEYRREMEGLRQAVDEALARGRDRFDLNLRIRAAKGPIWIGGAASFTDFDPDTKKPAALYAVYRETTDIIEAQEKQKQAELRLMAAAALEKQLDKMRRMIDDVPTGLGALRIRSGVPDETIQLNRYFNERIDIANDESGLVNLDTFLACLHPEDRTRCRNDFEKFLQSKEFMTRPYRIRVRGGQHIWISVRGTVVRMSESTEIAYFVFTNINEMKEAEAKLRQSQRFYREVVRAAKLSTWDYDIESHTITLSADSRTERMGEIFGTAHVIRNVPGSIAGHVSEEDRPAFLRMHQEVEAGRNASCEAWYKPENGREPRCERITYIVMDRPDGKPKKAIGFSQNITADRKVAERYQRELGYLRETDENNLLAKGHFNLTRNTVLEYTTKNDRIFKVRAGTPYDDAFRVFAALPYTQQERQEAADKLERMRLIEQYQQGQMQTSLVFRRARIGELPAWVSVSIHTYMMPETGDLECFAYAYDVSWKMKTDEIIGLIADEEFDYIGIIYTDTDEFEYIKKNRRITNAEVRERISYADMCRFVCESFVSEAERAQYLAAVSSPSILSGLRADGGRHTATYHRMEGGRLLCKQLDYVWLDEIADIVLVVRSDVTASFERDQQQLARIESARLEADRANEAKSAFLSSMSHDLRTPLNGVLGFTSFALRESDPEKKQAYLQKIDASGRLLLDLVNDTLELSRIESGKAFLEEEVVMPDELVPAVLTALRPSAELKGVQLISDLASSPSGPLWCDKLKCQKIALNLISNAIKYTPEGGVISVSLQPLPTEVPDCRLSLVVEDNGIGMSEEFMKRMYEPFAQEKRSEAVQVPGTGLGLSIVKRYVDLMNGKIEVTSRLHHGTRWVVSLPIRAVRDGQARRQEISDAECVLFGKHVLLCEDNLMNTEIAVMLLKDKGILVETAENGKEGLDKFAASAVGFYSCILMDLRMPAMDGFTAARAIRALNRPDAAKVPMIAMTADAFEESIREAKESGMDGYVTKPIEPQKLFAALRLCTEPGGTAGRTMMGDRTEKL